MDTGSPELIFDSYSCARRLHMVRLTRARPFKVSNAVFIFFGELSARIRQNDYSAPLDFDGNGILDALDLDAFRQRFVNSVTVPQAFQTESTAGAVDVQQETARTPVPRAASAVVASGFHSTRDLFSSSLWIVQPSKAFWSLEGSDELREEEFQLFNLQ